MERLTVGSEGHEQVVSLQEHILSAAYARATAVEERFLDAFRALMARSGDAFAAESVDEQRLAELQARRDLEEQQERGHAA
ncbi:hypothetical protein ABZ478_33900 [Streptomyces sp. NPDC005706]|uniref:hypothetical protein n=1 Tax=Streptomyces sp. NPDC005706 TaxID=3157169 RepID=UPI0033C8E938